MRLRWLLLLLLMLLLLLVLLWWWWRGGGEGGGGSLLVVVVLVLLLVLMLGQMRRRVLRVLTCWRQRIGRGRVVGRMRVHGSLRQAVTERLWLQGETLPGARRIM